MSVTIPVRQLSFDTETTGLPPREPGFVNEHRIVDLALVELIDFVPTGRTFQSFFNPDRDVDPEASGVHGLTDAFLADKPPFVRVVDDILSFLDPAAPGGEVQLVAHNAEFDMRFLLEELGRVNRSLPGHVTVVDTLPMARKRYDKWPSHTLDAIATKLGLDRSARSRYHGAMVDAQLLVPVFLHLSDKDRLFAATECSRAEQVKPIVRGAAFPRRPAIDIAADVLEAHVAYVARIPGNLWPDPVAGKS